MEERTLEAEGPTQAKTCKFGSVWPVQGIASHLAPGVQLPQRATATDPTLFLGRGLSTHLGPHSEYSEDAWQHCTSIPYHSVAFRNSFSFVFHVTVKEQVTSTVLLRVGPHI